MLILNQEKDKLINLDFATTIELTLAGDGCTNEIYVSLVDDAPESLGVYVTKDRAREIFMKIAEMQGGTSTYIMPEE